MPRGTSYCEAALRRAKYAVNKLFPALIVLLLGSAQASPPSVGPTSSTQLRHFSSPLSFGENIRVFTSPGNPYLNNESGAFKRSAQIFFSDRQRTNVKRSDILQSLEEHLIPWMVRGSNQGIISSQDAIDAALSRTLFFGDYPHERALESHLSHRESEGLPTLRLGSIRFSSPFLLDTLVDLPPIDFSYRT